MRRCQQRTGHASTAERRRCQCLPSFIAYSVCYATCQGRCASKRDICTPIRAGEPCSWGAVGREPAGRVPPADRNLGSRAQAARTGRGVDPTRGARPSSTDVDPPGRRFAETGGHLVAELDRLPLHLEGMLRELLALVGEGLLLFGAEVGTRRANTAGRC